MSFNAGEIEAALVLNRDQFTKDLDQAKADAAKFSKDPVTVKVIAEGDQAKATFDDLTARKDKLAKDVTVTVKTAGTAAADAELDKTALKADALGRKDVTVKVKTDGADSASKSLDDTGKSADDLGKKIDNLTSGPFSALITAAVGFGPAAIPVIGAVSAALVPLTAALGSAAVGLGAFGLLAKQNLTAAGTAAAAVQKAQDAYNVSIATGTKQASAYRTEQKAIGLAYAELSPAQIALSKQVGDLSNAWQNVQQSTAPLISGALQPWLKAVTSLMQYLKPLVTPVAAVFKAWGEELNKALTGNAGKIKTFMDAFAGRSADNIKNFGDALISFAKGMGSLIHDIAPDLAGASGGIAKLAASFAGWAKSQKTADDIKGFFTWAKAEMPTVRKFIDDLATTIGNLVKAMAFSGGGDLTVLTTVLGAVAKLPPAAIVALADGYVALSIGLRAAALAMGAWNAISAVAATIQAALNTEVEATGAALVLQKIAALAMAAADTVVDAAETIYIALMLAADAASLPLAVVIGGIVLAVAALGAGIYELVTHWTTVWHDILAVTRVVWDWITGNWPLLLAILTGPIGLAVLYITDHWHAVTDAFSDVIDWIDGHWKLILAILTGPIGAAVIWITDRWTGITQGVSDVIDWIDAHWRLLFVILTGPVGLAALWLVHAWAGIHNDIDAAWTAIAAFFTSWWDKTTAAITAAVDAIKSVLSAAWTAITSVLETAWNAIANYLHTPVTAIENTLKTAWAAITSALKTAWAAVASFFTSWWNTETGVFKNAAAAIGTALSAAWSKIESGAKTVFGAILSYFGTFWSALKSGFGTAVSAVAAAWDKIESVVRIPVQWVISNVYDKLIVPFWNAVAAPVGLGKLKAMAEGGIVPGGYSRDDNQLVWMRSGEGVLQPGAVSALGGPGFIHWANRTYGDVPAGTGEGGHFGGGGILSDVGGVFTKAWDAGLHLGGDALKALASVTDVRQWLKLPLDAIEKVIDAVINATPGSSGVAEFMKDGSKKIVAAWIARVVGATSGGGGGAAGAGAAAAGAFGKYTGSYGSGVTQWTSDVLKALSMLALPASDLSLVLRQITSESGGNPNAINLSDSNAQAGDPSRGLLQCIMTTFEAFRSAAFPNDIYDPMANIYAAINYADHTPGVGIGPNPGQLGGGSGYDLGGWLMPGATMAVNTSGRPEPVLSADQWDAVTSGGGGIKEMLGLMRRVAAATEQAPGRIAGGVSDGLNGVARGSGQMARYQTRGRGYST